MRKQGTLSQAGGSATTNWFETWTLGSYSVDPFVWGYSLAAGLGEQEVVRTPLRLSSQTKFPRPRTQESSFYAGYCELSNGSLDYVLLGAWEMIQQRHTLIELICPPAPFWGLLLILGPRPVKSLIHSICHLKKAECRTLNDCTLPLYL